MAFDQSIVDAARIVANKSSISLPAILAVIEIESGGKPFEQDNRTPRFLFERHIFYRELKAINKDQLQTAIAEGLAIPAWSRNTQYKDQGSSAGRFAVLQAARSINPECANRSCSWGLGQTMGFLCKELGFQTATTMVQYLSAGGIQAQIDVMIRFIKSKKLIDALNAHNWEVFARGYNGAGFRQNQYDTRLSAAYLRWVKAVAPNVLQPDDLIEVPLDRVPIQNAEVPVTSAFKTPEGIATVVGAGTGVVSAGTAIGSGSGPIAYAFAIVIVIAAVIGAYFILKRLKENPA